MPVKYVVYAWVPSEGWCYVAQFPTAAAAAARVHAIEQSGRTATYEQRYG